METTGSGPYAAVFEPHETGGSYLVLSLDALKTPVGVSLDTPSTLSDSGNGADYILITSRNLGWDGGAARPWLRDLLSFRGGQGLRVKGVDIEEIYDEFSYGIPTPQAIKDFLGYAYTHWVRPAPQYVLLVGKGSYDYKDNLGLGTVSFVPVYLTVTDYLGETISDDWFVEISGEDAIPEMAIGRLPAETADQAETMVGKILAYERAPNTKTWEKKVLLVADNKTQDYEAVFETMNEDLVSLIPAGFSDPFRGYLGDYVTAQALTSDLKERIDQGALIVHYSGHGSTQIWANESIFSIDAYSGRNDVAELTNGDRLPFFVSMSCLTGYFAYPEAWDFPSLVEALLEAEGKGAVACLMPTGMTETDGQEVLDRGLFDAIFTQDIRALGQAVCLAKETLLANGSSYRDVAETFLFFGDPAMELKVPLPRRPVGLVAQGEDGAVALSWQPALDSSGGPVSGYNLYRSTQGGPSLRVNTSLITDTRFVDGGLTNGTPYAYGVTSVDSDGLESVRSQEASGTPEAPATPEPPPAPATPATDPESSSGCFIARAMGR
jgi:hypothetical protein